MGKPVNAKGMITKKIPTPSQDQKKKKKKKKTLIRKHFSVTGSDKKGRNECKLSRRYVLGVGERIFRCLFLLK